MYQIYANSTCIFDDTLQEFVNLISVPWSSTVDYSGIATETHYINGNTKKWASSSSNMGSTLPIPAGATSVTMTAPTGKTSYYTLLKTSTYTSGAFPDYATGFTNRVSFTGSTTVTIPADAHYLWVYRQSSANGNITPETTFSGASTAEQRNPCRVISPKLTLTAGAAGSLSFTVPKGAYGYDTIQRLTTTISVLRDGETIWKGRVLSEQRDLWDNRQLFCEGALAFLNDTVPMIPDPDLSNVLLIHNSKVAPDRQITAGTIAYGGVDGNPDGSSALNVITNKLVGTLGGVLRMRYPAGVPTLDWLENYPAVTGNEQTLEFGENLLEFSRSWDMTDFATVCWVQGAEIQDSSGGTGTYYNSGWVQSTAAQTYGRIEKFLNYSDLDSVALCTAEANAYLATQQFAEMQLQVTALDLHILNPAIKSFDLLERVHVLSWPHGLDSTFAVTGIEIPLDAPENTTYTLGFVNVAYVRRVRTLTKQQLQQDEQLREDIDAGVSAAKDYAEEKAGEAYEQASAEIETERQRVNETLNTITQGYVYIDYDANGNQGIYIVHEHPIDSLDDIQVGDNVWQFTAAGLGHTANYQGDQTVWNVAITWDGTINANRILTGLLMAQYIKLYGDMAVYNGETGTVPGGFIGYGLGQTDVSQVPGIHMYMDTGARVNEIIATSSGVRMSSKGSNGVGNLSLVYDPTTQRGTVTIDGELIVNGDVMVTGTVTQNWTPPT